MSFLQQVKKGKIKKPHLVLVYGPDGCGKTTFGASAPKSIIVGPESGSNNLDVARYEPKTYHEIMSAISELTLEKHDFETLVLDSLDWMEPMVWAAVCEFGKVKSIEQFGGGYGKGYTEAQRYWLDMMQALKNLRERRNMNVVVIAHSQIKAFNDPAQPAPYDRYMLKLNEKASALWREFVDTVLFATFEVYVKEADGKKTKAYGDGMRVAFTERRPGYDAKNRFGLPHQIPFSWSDYEREIMTANPDDPNKLKESISAMIDQLSDEQLKIKVIDAVQAAGDNAQQLHAIKNRLAIRLGDAPNEQ